VPLLVAGVVTLELCVVFRLPLNFSQYHLPAVGVAFKIYYAMAWRAGKTALLQSVFTRAVIFSAMTTATAFGGPSRAARSHDQVDRTTGDHAVQMGASG
jgi:hypothetical protein